PEVRRALMTAINSEELINAVVGYGEPIQTFVPSAVSPNLDRWSYDLEKAKEMLEEAGWDFDRKLQLVTYYGTDRFRNILQAIASYWDRIGVKADVTLVGDFSTFNERWGSTDWGDICFCGIGARGLAWSTIDHYIHSERTYSKGFNAGYASDKADELIEKLRETADQDERIELLYELEEVVHEDVALGPIWAVMETRVINKRLNNYKFNVVANMPAYFGTYLWWIEE
ncbi:MAG: ABC transporter substrate-binding protein, partial [Candidatus Bipolaricaulota bacterium]